MLRRSFTAFALLLPTLCVPAASFGQGEPIRIGFLTVRSGALAAGGKQMEEGIQLFLKERNHTLAGRKVELIIADNAGNPALAKTKTQELVERNKVHVVIGPLAAFEAIAIDDYIRQTRTPTVSCSAAAEDLTQRKPNPWFVRTVVFGEDVPEGVSKYADGTQSVPYTSVSSGYSIELPTTPVEQSMSVPVMGRIAAGSPISAIQQHSHDIACPPDLLTNGEHFALEVKGDSMIEAGIHDGDIVIVRRCDTAENGDVVVALVDSEEATLKRLRKKGTTIALEAANPEYKTRIFGPDQIDIQGRLVALMRRY